MDTLASQLHSAHIERVARLNGPRVVVEVPIIEDDRFAGLEASFAKLSDQLADALETLERQGATIALVSKQFAEVNPYMSEIMDAVCDFYGVTRKDLTASRRTMNITRPRQIVCFLGRKLTGLSLPQIGARLGNRDHTTVLHGANKVATLMQGDEILRDDLDVIEAKIADKVLSRQKPLRGQS